MKLAEMTAKQLKTRKRFSTIGAFLMSVMPISCVIASKWSIWVQNPGQAVTIGAGGIMVGAVVILSILGRLKIPGDVWVAAFLFVLLLLLKPIIDDLLLLSGAYLGGRLGDKIFTASYVKRVSQEIEDREAAERAGKSVMDGVKEYLEGRAYE